MLCKALKYYTGNCKIPRNKFILTSLIVNEKLSHRLSLKDVGDASAFSLMQHISWYTMYIN